MKVSTLTRHSWIRPLGVINNHAKAWMLVTKGLIALWLLILTAPVWAIDQHLDFTLHKLDSGKAGSTLLVIGGIQGDEPGGFNAASLLVTHYDILSGRVWVVPNLNFISIVRSSRGVYGDLNRKFSAISNNDPEYEAIRKIKSIILDKQVDLILNLHDGSGFYRHRFINTMHGPARWGQCVIVDQERLESVRFGELAHLAGKVVADINGRLYNPEHAYRIKNTKTRQGNTEMAKTLTYFAVKNNKPAFGLEASKSFLTDYRAYYHLRSLESFMNIAGIAFRRKFDISAEGVKRAIDTNAKLAFYGKKIFLDIRDARKQLNYLPLKKDANVEFISSNPLITIIKSGNNYSVFHGNRNLTRIHPQYFEYDTSINAITMLVDGVEKTINFGEMVNVTNSFQVKPRKGYRVNVIGFRDPAENNESGITIRKNKIQKRFSVDTNGQLYRVEVYKENLFSGMVLVNFNSDTDLLLGKKNRNISPSLLARYRRQISETTNKGR